MFKFLHAADIHLDSPLRGLEEYEGAPVSEIRNAGRRALQRLVSLAVEEQVSFVLISGDLYDGNWTDFNTGLFFISAIRPLFESGIPLFLIAGNHDAANKMTRSLRFPDNVTMLSHHEPESHRLADWNVTIHGQSYATQAVKNDLSLTYPRARRGDFNIGMLHTCATGAAGHESYAPCTLEGLRSKEYDYWALGHVHQRGELLASPHVVFPGNLQGRHVRETGAKGCYLVTVGADRSPALDFRTLDVVRWARVEVDLTDCDAMDDMLSLAEEEVLAAVAREASEILVIRVELTGATRLHADLHSQSEKWASEIRAIANAQGGGRLWIEKVKMRTSPLRGRKSTEDCEGADGPRGAVEQLISSFTSDSASIDQLNLSFTDILRKLPPELSEEFRPDDPAWQQSLIEDAAALLSASLQGDSDT